MATTKAGSLDEKANVTHLEVLSPTKSIDSDYPVKDVEGVDPTLDYSGAQKKKTDPAEIALVKKLDRYIMPTLWIMYWLNYLDRNAIALAKINTLVEDTGVTDTQYQV